MRNNTPTPWFWNFTGIGLTILSIGVSWSLIRASNYELEAVNHKLKVNTAVERVKKEISNTTEDVRYLPTNDQKKLENRLESAVEVLIQTQENILEETGQQFNSSP